MEPEKKTILMLGTFDSKVNEFQYLYEELLRRGVAVMTMDVGVFKPQGHFHVDITSEEVAESGGRLLKDIRARGDRGEAMKYMSLGARSIALSLQKKGIIQGIISMGGGGGTSVAATAMQGLPLGFPKVCISTLASGNTQEYVGTKDIVLFPSIVDICGINRFSRMIMSRAAGAVCGMVELDPIISQNDKPVIAISMFGNSTPCVEKCSKILNEKGFATVIFHATGSGGKAMEDFIVEGNCIACLDITTTEWADEICGGILSAGSTRLDGPGKAHIPHLIVPGCLDMVNFGTMDTVPEKYVIAERKFYNWNPMVTLMRTNEKENEILGKILAEKANESLSPVAFLFPLEGISILDGVNQPFCDWKTDKILFESIRKNVKEGIPIKSVEANLNDDLFAEAAVENLLELMNK